MIAVSISYQTVAMYELKRIFFLFLLPALIGLAVALLYPMAQKAAQNPTSGFHKVWALGALGPAFMLFAWSLTVRTIYTAPFYGVGYGLGVALLSRVHTIEFWPFRIETRRAAAKRLRSEARAA